MFVNILLFSSLYQNSIVNDVAIKFIVIKQILANILNPR